MKTSPSSVKIRQLITLTRDNKLIPRPEFQRRLVWTAEDKARFIDTILRSYPFPEIYLANGDVNVDTGEGSQLLVDGQQRVTTIVAYFQGDPTTFGPTIPPYAALDRDAKEAFLNYDVAVRDLGSVSPEQIVEVFRRINSTKYALNNIEVNNAVYAGELMRLASVVADHEFFETHKVFRNADIKRMGDVRFALHVLITYMAGYFNRDDFLEEFLSNFNDQFPDRDEVFARFEAAVQYIDECGFDQRSRVWKKSDLFTALVQIDLALTTGAAPNPSDALGRIEQFYSLVDDEGTDSSNPAVAMYTKASLQASNDRINRVRRGVIFEAILSGGDPVRALNDQRLL